MVACRSEDKSTQLNTITGRKIDLSDSSLTGSVLMFLAPDCPLCQSYTLAFQKLEDKYKNKLGFYGVISGKYYNQNEIDHYIDSFHFDVPIIRDENFELAHSLDAQVTPHFYLLDNKLDIKYNGRLDNWAISLGRKKLQADSFFLENAIESFSKNEQITLKSTKPVGCILEYD